MVVTGAENYTTAYTYDNNNRLLTEAKTEDSATVTTSYTYDANGNTLSVSTPANGDNEAVTKAYSYNRFNQQVRVLTNDVPTAQYTYNAQGIRTSKTVGTEQTSFLLDGGNVVAEIQGESTASYLRGVNLISKTADATEYYLFNAHGDVVNLTSSTGAVTKTYNYDAFGNERTPDSADTNPFRYCGEYYDTEAGTYYLRARYYDPLLGRFTTEDPILAGLNWYTYCGNNPIYFYDPFGLEKIVVSGGKYDDDPTKTYQYEFIDSALYQIVQWKDTSDEAITWAISTAGWSEEDITKFITVADEYGVNLLLFDNVDTLIDYINNGGTVTRSEDLISEIYIFSHGFSNSVSFGYHQENEANYRLSIKKVGLLDASAFKEGAFTVFFSCNAGTGLQDSIAQAWATQTGRTAFGMCGKSSYSHINAFDLSHPFKWLKHRIKRNKHGGFAMPYPSFAPPQLGHIDPITSSYMIEFKPGGYVI